MKINVYPWSLKSAGARKIAKSLDCMMIKSLNSAYVAGPDKIVINWGSSKLPEHVKKSRIINKPSCVFDSINKIRFFKRCAASIDPPRIPEFTENMNVALEWLGEGRKVMGRLKIEGKDGEGIVFPDDLNEFLKSKVFVELVDKDFEFRLHFAFGKCILEQERRLRFVDDEGNKINRDNVDMRVRNGKNGFILAVQNVETPKDVLVQGTKAYTASGLDFGALDIGYNVKQRKAWVFEMNTSPEIGIKATEAYTKAFKEHFA